MLSFKTAKGNRGKPYTQITGRTQLQVIFDFNFVDVHLATDGSDKEWIEQTNLNMSNIE